MCYSGDMNEQLPPNTGKELRIDAHGAWYDRFPIKTHIIVKGDSMLDVVDQYARPHMESSDMLFISERICAISQGRAFPIKDIHPSRLAKFLVNFVHKSKYGIGLGSPWTMELAIREAGAARILFAAFCSAITKPFGLRGVFYRVVGKNINAIDGPCSYTLPPYNEYAKLGPAKPNQLAKDISEHLGIPVVIIDANDLGVEILGRSDTSVDIDFCKQLFRDNPLGQSRQQTPMALIRPISSGGLA